MGKGQAIILKPEEVRLTIAITHVPDDPLRRAMLQQIIKALGQDFHRKLCDFLIIRDTHRKGPWPTTKTAWILSMVRWDVTHCLVLQDDMLPCADFIDGVKKAIAQRPEDCINLFSMRKIIHQARERGDSWCTSNEGNWGGSAILPVKMVDDFLQWNRQHIAENYPHDDRRLMLYLHTHNMKIWQTVPCLLEHIGAAHSLLGHSNARRVAAWYCPGSALDIDWTRGIDAPLYQYRYPPDMHRVIQPTTTIEDILAEHS